MTDTDWADDGSAERVSSTEDPVGGPTGGDRSPAGDGRDEQSVLFRILADRNRRHVLYCLHATGGTISIDELARRVATVERAAVPLSKASKESVERRLHHVCVPKLVDTELVTFDRGTGGVTLADDSEQFHVFLRLAQRQEFEKLPSVLAGRGV